jgi:phage gpG-like protein
MVGVSMDVTLDSDDRAHAMWDAIGAAMVTSTQLRFREGVDPEGDPWKPSERVIKHGGATLIEYGYLLASQTHNVLDDGDGVEWGSNLIYAAVHQTGYVFHREAHEQTIHRKVSKSGELGNRFVKKKDSNFDQDVHVGAYDIHLPARPYLGINEDDEATIETIAQNHLAAALLGTTPGSVQ